MEGEKALAMSEQIEELSEKKAIIQISDASGGFISTAFLVPKSDGSLRPVINLKAQIRESTRTVKEWRETGSLN